MSSVEELTIVLEHDIDEQYQYQPGEIVRGHVRIKVARPTALRLVTVRVVGEGNVSWREAKDGTVHQAEEKYVDASKVVLDTKDAPPVGLPPGYHRFSFEYRLPENLPSSYIGKFGNVTYTMKASVTGVQAVDTAITSEPFLMLRRTVLPEAALQPATLSQEKRLWGACSFGKVSAQVTLEERGGVPGQDVFLHAEIKNRSRRTVTALQAALVMASTYHARKNSTCFQQVVSKKRDECDVGHNLGRRWNYVRLTLPPYIPETHLEFSDIIEVDYTFQFRVELSGGAELNVELPFLMGSHRPGQDGPRRSADHPAPGAVLNRQWTVRARGFPMDHADDDDDQVSVGLEDPRLQWGWSSGVPELRSPDKAVMTNPLYRHGSLGTGREGKEVPEEQMEITRL